MTENQKIFMKITSIVERNLGTNDFPNFVSVLLGTILAQKEDDEEKMNRQAELLRDLLLDTIKGFDREGIKKC